MENFICSSFFVVVMSERYMADLVSEPLWDKLEPRFFYEAFPPAETLVTKVVYDGSITSTQRERSQQIYDELDLLHFAPDGETGYHHVALPPHAFREGKGSHVLNGIIGPYHVAELQFAGYGGNVVGSEYVPSPHALTAQTWDDWIRLVEITRMPLSEEERERWEGLMSDSRLSIEQLFADDPDLFSDWT